ncbi:hypothetical protein [Clostridium tetani]|uniref:hypothetical protein n=1 Tax=Clostridium tetani TaxID=1513 RepID=UPI002954965E|nr:hypothetical protein [Clostridium tetani]BDR86132.1 hypothetical protein N071400001_07400 [Clostridium tetani]
MAEKEIKFSKEQILSSKQFTIIEKDILKALLEDKQYSLKEVKKIIDDFNKKEVK